jgi:hypothetical protein
MLAHKLRAVKKESVGTITFVGVTQVQSGTGTTLTIPLPSGTTTGDLMIATGLQGSTGTWSVASGWTLAMDNNQRFTAWKIAGASEPSGVFTASISAAHQGFIATYRNAAFDVAGLPSASGGSPATAPAITLTANNSTVLAAFTDRTSSTGSWTTPTGYSIVSANADSTAPSTSLFSKASVASGSSGTVTSTGTGATNSRGHLIGIKPA